MLAEAGFQFIGEWTQDPESQINIGHGLPKSCHDAVEAMGTGIEARDIGSDHLFLAAGKIAVVAPFSPFLSAGMLTGR